MKLIKTLLLALAASFAVITVYAGNAKEITLFKKYPAKGWYGSGWNGAQTKIVNNPTSEKGLRAVELSCSDKVKPFAGCVFRTKKSSSVISIPADSLNKAVLTFKVYTKENTGQDVTIKLLSDTKSGKYQNKINLSDFANMKEAVGNWVDVSIPLTKFSDKLTDISGIMFRFNRKPAPIFLSLIKIEEADNK